MTGHAQRRSAFATRALAAKQDLLRAIAEGRAYQQRFLMDEYVRPNQDTVYGRQHGYREIASICDFQSAVPIVEYAALQPFVERALAGEQNVLTAEPVLAFNTTSGTSGASKYIPVTPSFHQNQDVRRRLTWWGNALEGHPEIASDDDAAIMFHFDPRPFTVFTPTWVPVGSHNLRLSHEPRGDLDGEPGTLAPWSSLPVGLDEREMQYFRIRLAIEHRLRALIAINPSTLVAFAARIAEVATTLISEVRDGTVLGKPSRAPNPVRARALEDRYERTGRLDPRWLWPELSLLSCWQNAGAALYGPKLRELYGDVDTLAWMYGSSEGVMSIPVDRDPVAAPLAVQSGFFEFYPAGEEPPRDGRIQLMQDVEVGKEYEIVMTQLNGLCRYVIGDVVRITGMMGDVPRVELVGRKGNMSSFTGEKLYERHVIVAATAALRDWTGFAIGNITCCPVWGDPPYYAFVVEAASASAHDLAGLARLLDAELGHYNCEYAAKRSSGRLADVEVTLVSPGTFARYLERRTTPGRVSAQQKVRELQADASARDEMVALSAAPRLSARAE